MATSYCSLCCSVVYWTHIPITTYRLTVTIPSHSYQGLTRGLLHFPLKGRYFVKRAGKRIRLVGAGVAGKKGGDPWLSFTHKILFK